MSRLHTSRSNKGALAAVAGVLGFYGAAIVANILVFGTLILVGAWAVHHWIVK